MPLVLLAHDQVVQENSIRTGGAFGVEPPGDGLEIDGAGGERTDLFGVRQGPFPVGFELKTFLLSFGLFAGTSGAIVIAILALLAAYGNIDQFDRLQQRMEFFDAGLSALPTLKQDIQAMVAEQKELREANRAQQAALESTSGKVAEVETQLRLSIDGVDRKLAQVADKSREREVSVGLRLDKIEAGKTALATDMSTSSSHQEDVARDLDPAEKGRSHALFRLRQIDGGVATIDGPSGSLTVTVGDTVPGLGKILKIGKRARYAVIVAVNQTLTAPWRQVAAAALRRDVEKKANWRQGVKAWDGDDKN